MALVVPERLANTTMETFGQNTSSCLGCHAMARTLSPGDFVSADFSFTLNNAQPKPAGTECSDDEGSVSCSDRIIPTPPARPETEWDHQRWADIQAGFEIATNTYEMLGPRHVGAKLHCSSCHLNAGGNPDAAWWVGMREPGRYPAKIKLQERINGCFERSMNGRAICSTAAGHEDCDLNPAMRGLLAYMDWLTETYREQDPDGVPTRGFRDWKSGENNGDYDRGQRTYAQKCSFCHNNEGQGRYVNDTYFRPALWGPDSFNACAGMAKKEKLAQFLRWNMPYTSGGMLTALEAKDLAAYIDAQCRPGKGGVGPDGAVCSLTPGCVDGDRVVVAIEKK